MNQSMKDPTKKDLAAFSNLLARRQFLGNVYTGLGGISLMHLLGGEVLSKERSDSTQESGLETWQPGRGRTHHPAKAKRVLQIMCPGAASHVDLWEHKPGLEKHHGKPLPGEENMVSFQGKNGNLMKSPWEFVACGESGKRITSMLPHMAKHVDDIAFCHAMHSKSNTHGPGCIFMNTGHPVEGFPTAGAWTSYALGSDNENLPTYVSITDVRGEPPNGKANWTNGFLPARHQAIMMSDQKPIRNLAQPAAISKATDVASRQLLDRLNSDFAAANPAETDLQARVAAYQLAARMQLSAPEVSDLSRETQATHELYGTNCLLYTSPSPRDATLSRMPSSA